MKQLGHLLKHDLTLLFRNRIVAVSIAVTAIYMALFKGMGHFGNTDKILILVIFNDPALLGFLFVGVMVLFEKNENTLQALAVSPMKLSSYIFSKTIALSFLSLICCYAMAYAGAAGHLNHFHYVSASLFTTVLFSFAGFILVAGAHSFNRFLLHAVGVLIFLSVPFLGYFEIVSRNWFLWVPTQPCIDLFRLSFDPTLPAGVAAYAYASIAFWLVLGYFAALRQFQKKLQS